jgi:hypothetical protein
MCLAAIGVISTLKFGQAWSDADFHKEHNRMFAKGQIQHSQGQLPWNYHPLNCSIGQRL